MLYLRQVRKSLLKEVFKRDKVRAQIEEVRPFYPSPVCALFRFSISKLELFLYYLSEHEDTHIMVVCLKVQYIHHCQKLKSIKLNVCVALFFYFTLSRLFPRLAVFLVAARELPHHMVESTRS